MSNEQDVADVRRYVVADGTQVNIDGTVYGHGETFEADPNSAVVREAVASGWAAEAPAKSSRRR